ncbi:dispanin subfamily A member 2b-like [Spea bombifrons]|uniref:dispanin subfamily A member 2b-like n=1 Tax=Spea bombifrons TaxID=233779 RepID=UPI00234AB1F3|nr:dispanin subfamily A member 2b-like [Spea bombifrons]
MANDEQSKNSFFSRVNTFNDYEPLREQNVGIQNMAGHLPQATVVTIPTMAPPLKDHLVWSIFNTAYLNFCCLGLLALVFSVKSRDRKLVGDASGARSYGSTAKSLNIAATVFSILVVVLLIILMATGVFRFPN